MEVAEVGFGDVAAKPLEKATQRNDGLVFLPPVSAMGQSQVDNNSGTSW